MRILLIHKHYPGPFKLLAQHYGHCADNTVLFLSERGSKSLRLPGVRRLRVAPPLPYETSDEAEKEAVIAQRRGAKVANSLLRLRRDGFIPDLILCASNDGYGLYVRDLFPEAILISRAEWFFTRGESHTFFTRGKPRAAADFAPARIRNLFQYNNLGDCDGAFAGTCWQKVQYPKFLQSRISVIHDGVDTEFFAPDAQATFISNLCDLRQAEELVSFSSRRNEPSRGFTQFWKALPALLENRPRCHAVIMGPEHLALPESPEQECLTPDLAPTVRERIHFVPFGDPREYRRLLQASTAHVYLTAPYTLSSGLLEAMSCGTLVVGSDTPPVQEVIRHGQNGFLTDFWDSAQLANTLTGVLENAQRFAPIRAEARRHILKNYEQRTQTSKILKYIEKVMEQKE